MAAARLLYALPSGRSCGSDWLPHESRLTGLPNRWLAGISCHVRSGDMGIGAGVSLEYCWPSLLFVASVYRPGIRMDDSIRGLICGVRHACNERSAFAVSPVVQCAQFP